MTSVSPRPLGRTSGYSEETVGRLCEVIRRRGLSGGEAARGLGLPRQTFSQQLPKIGGPTLADFGASIEENQALRAQLRGESASTCGARLEIRNV